MGPVRNFRNPRQRGATIVEFALVSCILFALLVGIVEVGRVMYTFDAAAEATRRGARVAAVIPQETLPSPADTSPIYAEMRAFLRDLQRTHILVTYTPARNCQYVRVELSGYAVPIIGAWGLLNWYLRPGTAQSPPCDGLICTVPVPPFATVLPCESMGND